MNNAFYETATCKKKRLAGEKAGDEPNNNLEKKFRLEVNNVINYES